MATQLDNDIILKEHKTEPVLVQMRLQPKTMQRLEHLVSLTGTTNRTQLISSSIHLAEEVVKNIEAGSKIYVETPDGKREVFKFIGL